ncbi:MAG: glycosyltransferase family 9 protein [Pseudomonadota bacterium]
MPSARLTWIIGKTEAGLMRGLEGVELIEFDKRQGRKAHRDLASKLDGRQFDVLLNLHASWRANLVSRLIRAQRKIGFDKSRARDLQWLFSGERINSQLNPHVIDGMFGFAEKLGVMQREMRWNLPLEPAHYEFAESVMSAENPTVLISPCSSERARNFRNWPAERYAAVARHAAERYGATIVLTGGNSDVEADYATQIANDGPAGVHNLVGRTSLKELAALIDRASVVICPDSGPAHIATAVGTPVIGLYATSNPGRTGPLLSTDTTVNAYPEAVKKYLKKSVSEVRWGQRVRHPDAMTIIATERVISRVDQLLA